MRQRTLLLTLQNLSAFEGTRRASDAEDNEDEAYSPPTTYDDVDVLFRAGEERFAMSDFDGAISSWSQVAKSFTSATCVSLREKLAPMTAAACSGLGYAYASIDESRIAIGYLLQGLGIACEHPALQQLQVPILSKLSDLYMDIGKDDAAEKCKDNVRLLLEGLGESIGADIKFRRLPRKTGKAMDEAIAASIRGDFGLLKSLVAAYRYGRGTVTLTDIVNYQHSETGASPLMVSAGVGNLEVVDTLLAAGARLDIEMTSADGVDGGTETALDWACKFGRSSVIIRLLSSNAPLGKGMNPQRLRSWPKVSQGLMLRYLQSKGKSRNK